MRAWLMVNLLFNECPEAAPLHRHNHTDIYEVFNFRVDTRMSASVLKRGKMMNFVTFSFIQLCYSLKRLIIILMELR